MSDRIIVGNIREFVIAEGFRGGRVNEKTLSKVFGASRTLVREALKYLEEEHLIERRQGFGISLRLPSLKELIEIYDIRIRLEGLAGYYFAQNLAGADIKKLKGLAVECSQARQAGDPVKTSLAEVHFHQFITDHCGTQMLSKMVYNLNVITATFNLKDKKMRWLRHKTISSHEDIIAALEKEDPAQAEERMQLHIQEAKQFLLKTFVGPGIN